MFDKFRERLRAWMTDKTNWLLLGTNAYQIYKLAKSYPGVADEAKLRAWLGECVSRGGELATLTETKIDDQLIDTSRAQIDDDESWAYIYGLLIKSSKIADFPATWDDPSTAGGIIAAIGMLTQLIAKIREKLQISEVADCWAAIKAREQKGKKNDAVV